MADEAKTVRDVEKEFLEYLGAKSSGDLRTPEQVEFWKELNRLGWEKRTKDPQDCEDIDVTAFISKGEYEHLTRRFKELPLL